MRGDTSHCLKTVLTKVAVLNFTWAARRSLVCEHPKDGRENRMRQDSFQSVMMSGIAVLGDCWTHPSSSKWSEKHYPSTLVIIAAFLGDEERINLLPLSLMQPWLQQALHYTYLDACFWSHTFTRGSDHFPLIHLKKKKKNISTLGPQLLPFFLPWESQRIVTGNRGGTQGILCEGDHFTQTLFCILIYS